MKILKNKTLAVSFLIIVFFSIFIFYVLKNYDELRLEQAKKLTKYLNQRK